MNTSKAQVLKALASLTAEDDHELDGRSDLPRQISEGLHHEDRAVRAASLEAAAALVHREVLEANADLFERALALSTDEDPEVRAESAVLLGVLPVRSASATRLQAMLKDAATIVRREAAAALGDLKDATSAGGLALCLEDTDQDTRFEAAYALAQLGDARGLFELIEALGRERHRMTACEALRKLRHPDAVTPLQRVARGLFVGWPDRLAALGVLHELGDSEAGSRVVERAASRNAQERAYALSLIGEHRISAGFGLLERAAKDPEDRARSFALKALGQLARGSDEPFFIMIACDSKTELEVRIEALRAVAGSKNAKVEAALAELARDPDPRLSREARRTISRRRTSR